MIVGVIITAICALCITFILWRHLTNTHIIKIEKSQIMDFQTSMDLSGLPIVTFYQNDKKYNFIMDTGSNVSYINVDTDMEITKLERKDTFFGSSGEERKCDVGNVYIKFKDTEYQCTVRIADLREAFRGIKKSTGITLSGILGTDFFGKYKYCFDFKELIAYARK